MTAEDAEQIAIPFGLTYLSREGYAKLAMLIEAVRNQARQADDDEPILENGHPID